MSVREGYKQTEIGVIPEEWEVKRIEEIAEVKGGKRLPKGNSLTEEKTPYPYIRVTDMYMGGINSTGVLYVPIDIQPQIKNYTISKDDLFISVAGTLGLVGDVPPELHNANLTENADKITNIQANKKYLLYVLLSDLIQNEINKQTTSNAQPKLALTRIKTFQIPFPSLTEQQKIAEILSAVDQKINSIDSKIEETQTLKRGLMQRLLSEGIRHCKFKESEIGRIPTGWEVKLLENCVIGKGAYGINAAAVKFTENLPVYLRITDIDENGKFIKSNRKSVDTTNFETYSLHEGDIVFARTGNTTGKTYLYNKNDGELIFAGFLIRFKPNNEILDSRYLKLYTETKAYWKWVKVMSSRTGQPGINGNEYGKLSLPIPPLEEQKQIAEILSTTDEKLESLRAKKEAFETLKKGLMQKLLSGEVRV